MKPPRLRRLGAVAGMPVYLVSGERVRNAIDIDFTQGGNEAAYPGYVPKGEIWIDDAMHALDATATVYHELVERDMMLNHGMTYDRAHDIACGLERILRKELIRKRPRGVDLSRVATAYQEYLRKGPPSSPTRMLEREIAERLAKPRRRHA